MNQVAQSYQRLHAIVHGRVQGVGFRYFVRENAIRLNITGWVRNRYNGTVEVTAEGTRQDLDAFLRVLHRGPSAANVTEVKYDWDVASGEFAVFKLKMTV
jgi:acylphosphatase